MDGEIDSSGERKRGRPSDFRESFFNRMKIASDSILNADATQRFSEAIRKQGNQKSLEEQRAKQEQLLREKLKELDPDLEDVMEAQQRTQQILVQQIVSDQDVTVDDTEREEWKKIRDMDEFNFDESPQAPEVSMPTADSGDRGTEGESILESLSQPTTNRGIRRRKHAWREDIDIGKDADKTTSAVDATANEKPPESSMNLQGGGKTPKTVEADGDWMPKISDHGQSLRENISLSSISPVDIPDGIRQSNSQKSLERQLAEQDQPLREEVNELDPVLDETMVGPKGTQEMIVQEVVSDRDSKVDDFKIDVTTKPPELGPLVSTGIIPSVNLGRGTEGESTLGSTSQPASARGIRRRKYAWKEDAKANQAASTGDISKEKPETSLDLPGGGGIPAIFEADDGELIQKISEEGPTSGDRVGLPVSFFETPTITRHETSDVIEKAPSETKVTDIHGDEEAEASEPAHPQVEGTLALAIEAASREAPPTTNEEIPSDIPNRISPELVIREPAVTNAMDTQRILEDSKSGQQSQLRADVDPGDEARERAKKNLKLLKSPKNSKGYVRPKRKVAEQLVRPKLDEGENGSEDAAQINTKPRANKALKKEKRAFLTKGVTEKSSVNVSREITKEAVDPGVPQQMAEIDVNATGPISGITQPLGEIHVSPSTDAAGEQKTVVVLFSKSFGSHSQKSQQDRAIIALRSRRIPFLEVDGSDPSSRKYRDQLFAISGHKGSYPQFFVRSGDRIAFLGDFNAFETLNESDGLRFAAMNAELKDITTIESQGTSEAFETNPVEQNGIRDSEQSQHDIDHVEQIKEAVPPPVPIGNADRKLSFLLVQSAESSLHLEDVFTGSASSQSGPSVVVDSYPHEEIVTLPPVQTTSILEVPAQSQKDTASFSWEPKTPARYNEVVNLQQTETTMPTEPAKTPVFGFLPLWRPKTPVRASAHNVTVAEPALSEEERDREQAKKELERIIAIEKLEEARREAAKAKRQLYADFENTIALTSMPPPLLDKKTLVLLISKRTASHAQRANQARAQTILSSQGLKYGVVDGSDPESESWRDELFELSGMKGTYPQLFLIDDEKVEFLGDFNKLLEMNEGGTLNGSLIEKPEEVKFRWQPHKGDQQPTTESSDAFAEAESTHARFGLAAFEAEKKVQEEIIQLRAEMARKEKAESEVRARLEAELIQLKATEEQRQETEAKTKQMLEEAIQLREKEEMKRQVAEQGRKRAESELLSQQKLLQELRAREDAEMARIRADEEARRKAEKEAQRKTEEEIQKRIHAETRIQSEEVARRAAELELERLRGILQAQASSQESKGNVAATLAIQKTIKALREAETRANQKAEEEAGLRAKEAKRRLEVEKARKKAELELLRLRKDIVRKQKIDKLRAEEEAELARERIKEEKRLRIRAELELEKLRVASENDKATRKENSSNKLVMMSAETIRPTRPRNASSPPMMASTETPENTKPREPSVPRQTGSTETSKATKPRGASSPRRTGTRKSMGKDDQMVSNPVKDSEALKKLQSMEEKLQMLKEEKLKQEQAKATKQIVKRVDKQQRSSIINEDATAESARLLAMQKKLAKLKARQALKSQPPVLLPEA